MGLYGWDPEKLYCKYYCVEDRHGGCRDHIRHSGVHRSRTSERIKEELMNKPITVERQETMQKLVDVVNGAQLPAFVLVDMLNEILQNVRTLARRQYARDAEMYAKAMEDQKGAE